MTRFAFRPSSQVDAQPRAPQAKTANVPVPQTTSGHGSGTSSPFSGTWSLKDTAGTYVLTYTAPGGGGNTVPLPAPVLLLLSAEVQAEELRARIQTVEPLDDAAAKTQKGLRVFLRNEEPIANVAKRLEPTLNGSARKGAEQPDGEVSVVLLLQNGSEVEVKLPGRFKVSPQIAGAIKAVAGVVTVEAL